MSEWTLIIHQANPAVDSRSDRGLPSGFIVTIALDPSNPLGSTREQLAGFEFYGIPIKEERD